MKNTAKRYRDRAEELRLMADIFSIPEHRKVLLSIAANFDQLAKSIEGIAKGRQSPQR
jgi:hypothetical protein